MNLSASIALNFGGPGSGCNPAAGVCGRPKGSGGEAFVSPNVNENLTLQQALTNLHSPEQQKFMSRAQEVAQKVFGGGKVSSTLGDWSDGAENSSLLDASDASEEDLNYAAAKLGMEANQKQVLTFARKAGGPDTVWQMKVPGSLSGVRASLDSHGINFRTLEPQADGVRVTVFDQGSQLENNVKGVASDYKIGIDKQTGTGNFIGGETREQGVGAFRSIVNDYERKYGMAAAYQRPDSGGRRDYYRGSFRLSEIQEGVNCGLGEPESAGTTGMGHLNVIPSFHPPSLRKPFHVPEYDDPSDDTYLDVTRRKERLMEMIRRLKTAMPSGAFPVRTTDVGLPVGG